MFYLAINFYWIGRSVMLFIIFQVYTCDSYFDWSAGRPSSSHSIISEYVREGVSRRDCDLN